MSATADIRIRLRAAILQGRYAPRQRLVEADLAEEFDATRFAIRNALIELASDGLVELQPHRGARIREISVSEAIEITEVRQAVEALVAARAAERATADDIAALRDIAARMRRAVADGELLEYSELNTVLHRTVRGIGTHETAARTLERLNAQMVHHQFRLALTPGRPTISLPEHEAIIDAIADGDADAAATAMAQHIGSVMNTLRGLLPSDAPALDPAVDH